MDGSDVVGPVVAGALVEVCRCGSVDCLLFELRYPYCTGCDEHHRAPVSEQPGERCPVDVWSETVDRGEPIDIEVTHRA